MSARWWGGLAALGGVVALGGSVPPVTAQERDTMRVAETVRVADTAQAADTATANGVGPGGAAWRSMLIPGWGQSLASRHVTGAVFVAWEGITAAMTIKADQEVRFLKRIESPALDDKRQERQDWLVLWVFNHLFAGAEAFVSAHLNRFPEDLEVRAAPGMLWIRVPLPALGR